MAGEGEGMPRVMRRVVDRHWTCEADTINEHRSEQDGEHSRDNDRYGAGSGFGGGREHADHGQTPIPSTKTAIDRRDAPKPGQLATRRARHNLPRWNRHGRRPAYPSALMMVKTPSAANTTATVMRIALTGSFSAILFPMRTAGIFASIMPRVVPMTTG